MDGSNIDAVKHLIWRKKLKKVKKAQNPEKRESYPIFS